jgi:hypothetical protein
MAQKQTFDKLVIELQKDEKSVISLSIGKNDIDMLQNVHKQDISTILSDIYNTLIENAEKNAK